MSTPFSLSEIQSFFTLFTIPLPVLKSVVQLLHHQQVRKEGCYKGVHKPSV